MLKSFLLNSLFTVVLLPNIVMATDFHALSEVHAATASIDDKTLSETEGGADCSSSTIGVGTDGVALCAWVVSGASGGVASFTVANEIPVTGAPFLQTVE